MWVLGNFLLWKHQEIRSFLSAMFPLRALEMVRNSSGKFIWSPSDLMWFPEIFGRRPFGEFKVLVKSNEGWRVRKTEIINSNLTPYSVNIQQISAESLLCAKHSGCSAEQNKFWPMDVYFSEEEMQKESYKYKQDNYRLMPCIKK